MSDLLRIAMTQMLDLLQPEKLYTMVWNYRVISATPGPPVFVSAKSLDPRMPDIAQVTVWPGPDGIVAVPAVGSQVRMGFISGDPRQPMIVGLDPNVVPTFIYAYATATVSLGDLTATPLTKATWATSLATALAALATALGSAASFANVNAAGSALTTALVALPTPTTIRTLGS